MFLLSKKWSFIYTFALLCCLTSSKINAYRILVVSPTSSKSHNNMLESVAKALAKKGHQVDVISHFELKNPPNNYKTIVNLNGTTPLYLNTWTMKMIDIYKSSELVYILAEGISNKYCKVVYQKKFQRFIKNLTEVSPYELIITEAMVGNCFISLGRIFKVPLVLVTALMKLYSIDKVMGNPISSAFTSHLHTKNAQILTYWDRVKNTFLNHYNDYKFVKYTEKVQTEIIRKYLSPEFPNIRDIEKDVSLLLVNGYQSMFGIKPNIPSVVQISGIQVEQSESEFTEKLEIWMDESTHGVILFSLGSMVIAEDSPEEILLVLYASFAKLAPTRVLMKIANEEKLPQGLPNNVLTMSWIPQISVLRHKNTRLFMTHGGLNSVQEALYFAVPMIAFPLFGDQELNADLLVTKNVVYKMDYQKITEKSLDMALNIVLNDPKYREATKRESRIYKDRPMNATDTAVFWIEYIIRNGANSLRSPTMDMNWWQAELLDVYGFLILCILLASYLAFIILKQITHIISICLHLRSQKIKPS